MDHSTWYKTTPLHGFPPPHYPPPPPPPQSQLDPYIIISLLVMVQAEGHKAIATKTNLVTEKIEKKTCKKFF
jgi:hypothetical protein